jgi:serine protease Do
VNVAIRAGAQGIGFAIPVDTMIRVTADMLGSHKRTPTWTGLVCRDKVLEGEETRSRARSEDRDGLTPSSLSVSTCSRCLLAERVEANGPAAKAGLQAGDTLVQVADLRVSSTLEFERALLDRQPGDKVPVVIRRQGAEQRIELVLQAPERAGTPPADLVWRKLGVRLSPVNSELVARTNQQLHGGLAVVEIRADGAAARAGIQRGDILVGLHQWEMLTLENVAFVLSHPDLATFQPVRFYIVRNGLVHRGSLQQID